MFGLGGDQARNAGELMPPGAALNQQQMGSWWINAPASPPLSGTTLGHILHCPRSSPEGLVSCLITPFLFASFPLLFPLPNTFRVFSGTISQINYLYWNACLRVSCWGNPN